jgi:putative hydrolase of the HAD superfamily
LNVEAVTFDLWETLLFERDGLSVRRSMVRSGNLAKAFNSFGFAVSVEQVASALKEVISELAKVWDANRDVSHHDQLELIIKHVLKGSPAFRNEWLNELSVAYISPIFEVPPDLNPHAREVLEWLKERKKRVGMICNTGLTPGFGLRRFLEHEGISGCFDAMVFSDEVLVRKPDPEIFRMTVRKLKVKPSVTVHVGDNLKADVWGAKNAGLKAVYLSTNEGRDMLAEADPTSLVSLSRNLSMLKREDIVPDKTITSLAMVTEAIVDC